MTPRSRLYSYPYYLLPIYMHHFRRREAVEVGRRGVAVGADVFAVDQIAQFQIGQFLGQRDGVQGVAGRAEDRGNLLSVRS